MALYAGEVVRVTNVATDFDGTPLDPTTVDRVTVAVYDSAGATVVGETPMAWSVEALWWYWDWNTAGVASGAYKARVTVYSIGGGESFEFKRIQLRALPAGVTL